MNHNLNWGPSGSVACVVKRNQLLAEIRQYFSSQGVLEVETPTLSTSTITDLHLEAMHTVHTNPLSVKKTHLFLQTSPEYYMKRLLCAGFPSIFQLTKCYRDDEVGRHHNPEFTMLEWYRLGFSMEELIDDVDNILRLILDTPICERASYQELFYKYVDLDPIEAADSKVVSVCQLFGFNNFIPRSFSESLSVAERDTLLQLLFCEIVEPKIGIDKPIAVTHFPASQASLAKINPINPLISQRFEFYYKGLELANGFEELTDSTEQRARFNSDNESRALHGYEYKPIDEKFLQALEFGLPECSGVALGVDRLLMIALDKKHLSEVLSFDFASL